MSEIDKTLAERGERYGRFEDHAKIAQGFKRVMWGTPRWNHLADDQKQALEVIQDKVARILNGDPDYTDNWHDIRGYAKLVEDRLMQSAGDPKRINVGAVKHEMHISGQALAEAVEQACRQKVR